MVQCKVYLELLFKINSYVQCKNNLSSYGPLTHRNKEGPYLEGFVDGSRVSRELVFDEEFNGAIG